MTRLSWLRNADDSLIEERGTEAYARLFWLEGSRWAGLILVTIGLVTLAAWFLGGYGNLASGPIGLTMVGLGIFAVSTAGYRGKRWFLSYLLLGVAASNFVAFVGRGSDVSMVAFVEFIALVLVAFAYLHRREAALVVGGVAVGYALVVITGANFTDPLVDWITVVATLSFVGTFTSKLVRRLARLAYLDELTKLPNRRYLLATLRREMAASLREGTSLSVSMIDLDGFKTVNDTQGHVAGDQLLERLGATWSRSLRANDFIGRYGGDEFVVICPRCPKEEAERVVTRLLRTTSKEISASWGCAEWDGVESLEKLIDRCDRGLYSTKMNRQANLMHPLASSPHIVIDLTGETQRRRDSFLR